MTQQDEPAAVADLLQDVRSVLARIEQHLEATQPPEPAEDDDDFAERNLIEAPVAAQRFGLPKDMVRRWCRDEACGVKSGGRWLASIPRFHRRITGA